MEQFKSTTLRHTMNGHLAVAVLMLDIYTMLAQRLDFNIRVSTIQCVFGTKGEEKDSEKGSQRATRYIKLKLGCSKSLIPPTDLAIVDVLFCNFWIYK